MSQSLETYLATLTALEEAQPHPSAGQILAVLKARDALDATLANPAEEAVEKWLQVVRLDDRLRQQTRRISESINIAEWRASLHPPDRAWWWFVEAPPSRSDRFDWLWSALTILCLTIALGLVADISSRFLSGGPDTWASLTVVGQSVLTLLAAGGALTVAGREAIKRILTSLKVPAYLWQEAKLGLAIALLVALVFLRLSLPGIAILYNNRGLGNYNAGRLTSAQFDYERALKLNPDYVEAHYNLALLYEDLQQEDKARSEYLAAVQGGLGAAYNNLARLDILQKDYAGAVPLLRKGLLLTNEAKVKYDLHKNLGWARLGQTRYEEAIAELQTAITLIPSRAPAHCLLAQVFDVQGDRTGAGAEWETCLKLADATRPDEDAWIGQARSYLAQGGQK